MLNYEDIENYFPESIRHQKKYILMEYFQYKILNILFSLKFSRKLIFIGGTAIRIIYNTKRFSEDLDFDNFKLTLDEFSDTASEVKKKLKLEGYEINIETTSKKDTFHYLIKIPKLLYDFNVTPHANQNLLIKVDTQSHNFKYIPEEKILNKFGVFTQINVAPKDILLSQKIAAVFNRKRFRSRDFYDTVFLFGITKPNYDYLKEKLNINKLSELKELLLKKCEKIQFKELENDIKPFLFNSADSMMVSKFKEYITGLN
ncbi:MAG: nucleotidyl transferase AbiEii/AbiGii toxin family protein [Candidatus Melainabacteria bacterium]|nr:nucleotidyl transferase AbiEii/AbiGii toxin family protein [Candidatus Melainabacteria bacterium]